MRNTFKKYLIPKYLCTRCGACVPICPRNVLRLDKDLYPYFVNSDLCINCNKCLNVCPGLKVDFSTSSEPTKHNSFLGEYFDLYEGSSRDITILENATSGGCITTLLLEAFKNGIIEAATVVVMSKEDPSRTIYTVVTNEREIKRSGQSKYQVTSLAYIIPRIKQFKRVAFVGLPCHIHAIRKYEAFDSALKKCIVVHLGTYCNGLCDYEGTRFILKKMGIKLQEIKKLEYRHGKWPGNLYVERDRKKPFQLNKNIYLAFLYLSLSERCLYCIDFTSELADISFGDAKETNLKGQGRFSQVIVRSKTGKEFFERLKQYLYLRTIKMEDIINPQKFIFEFKKIGAFYRMTFRRRKPVYLNVDTPQKQSKLIREIRFMIFYRSRKIIKIVLNFVPNIVIFKLSKLLYEQVRKNKL